VCFPGTIIATFYSIVKKSVMGITITLVILGGIYPSLACDGMRAPWGILITKGFYVISKFRQSSGSTAPSKTGTNYNNIDISLVGRVNEMYIIFMFCPLVGQRTFGNF